MMLAVVAACLALGNYLLSKSHLYLSTPILIMPPSSVPENTSVDLVR